MYLFALPYFYQRPVCPVFIIACVFAATRGGYHVPPVISGSCLAGGTATAPSAPAIMSLGYTVHDTVIIQDGPLDGLLFLFAYGVPMNEHGDSSRVRSYLRIVRLPARINVSLRLPLYNPLLTDSHSYM